MSVPKHWLLAMDELSPRELIVHQQRYRPIDSMLKIERFESQII